MKCARCSRDANIEIKYAKGFLCNSCFLKSFEKRVRKNIRVNCLLHPRDKTAVALSGGKDSAVALYMLDKLHRKAPGSELVAVSIDQGIGEYQRKGLRASEKLCNRLGVEHLIFSFKEEFGLTMDELAENINKLKNPAPACSYCGVLRRRLLNDKAKELGITKIATGHNLDDEIQTSLMNFVRGELDRMARMGASVGMIQDEAFVPRIKPLRNSPEDEVLLYAKLKDLEFEPNRCPYSGEAFRETIRKTIEQIEKKHPGSKFQILKSTDRLIPIIRSTMKAGSMGKCKTCGGITSGDLCRVCQIKKELGLD